MNRDQMAYATSLENFMRQELRNFDMCRSNNFDQINFVKLLHYTCAKIRFGTDMDSSKAHV